MSDTDPDPADTNTDTNTDLPPVSGAQLVLGCADLNRELDFFQRVAGFRLDMISPADDPAVAELSAHGLNLRLCRGAGTPPARIRLLCEDPQAARRRAAALWPESEASFITPGGNRVEFDAAAPPLTIPPPQPARLVVTRRADGAWQGGRAGMSYRDLIPDRLGGRYIASHIRIDEPGPVADYPHYHEVRLQMIYCYRGWVRLVYQDQGPPFVMQAGDCVLQPPGIRHRVLESGAGLEVLEIASPAEHPTRVEHGFELPTEARQPQRLFGGQRFVWHKAADALWQPCQDGVFATREFGFARATAGLAGAGVLRPLRPGPCRYRHDGEFCFWFVLAGAMTLRIDDGRWPLGAGDGCVLPSGADCQLDCGEDLELLALMLPAPPCV